MSHDLLAHLARAYAFDGTPLFHDLGAYHVPFDSMTCQQLVEARLSSGSSGGERIALIAESGAGKSSVVSHVLGPDAPDVAPILVPVHWLGEDASTPDRVADEILSLLGRDAREVAESPMTGASRRVTAGHRRSTNLGLNLPWLKGELAKEVGRQTEIESPISLREKSELVDLVLHRIHRDGLQPVIIFDDSDRWLAGQGARTVSVFFRDVVRWLADFPTSVVVATHTHYLEQGVGRAGSAEADLLEFLDTRITIPRVPSAEMIARILENRIVRNSEDTVHCEAVLSDVVSEQAIAELFGFYSHGASLRRTLQTAHIALADAVSTGAETVQANHIVAAQQA